MLYQTVLFGSSKAGLATIGYRLYDAAGTPVTLRLTTGIQDLGEGQYGAAVDIPSNFIGRITWDTGGVTPVFASSELNTPDYEQVTQIIADAIKQLNVTVRPERTIFGPIQPSVVTPLQPKRY